MRRGLGTVVKSKPKLTSCLRKLALPFSTKGSAKMAMNALRRLLFRAEKAALGT